MIYGSVCSGIEAATVAWHPLGWQPAWFSEIAPFPCRILAHHYPSVPNLGDMMVLENNPTFLDATINLLVGGTPCQSFSLAGLRGGLADLRGNLSLQFCRLLQRKRPRWFVWENVPGVLSSFTGEADDGVPIWQTSDFASLLVAFQECGYSVAWRVLDSQFFGVPQRRSRVFVVGYLGDDWRPPAAVLFERESCGRNITSGQKEGENIAGTLTARSEGGGFPGTDESLSGYVQLFGGNNYSGHVDVAPSVNTRNYNNRMDFKTGGFVVGTIDANYGRLQGCSGQDLRHKHSTLVPITYPLNQICRPTNRNNPTPGDPSCTITADAKKIIIIPGVRRLTPLECERLQGFPDHYTAIPGAADSPRYEAIGNSMTVHVMRWIGKRIDFVHKLLTPKQ